MGLRGKQLASSPNGTAVAFAISVPHHFSEQEKELSLINTQTRCRSHASRFSAAKRSATRVSKGKAEDLLREIAFILQATRRISKAIVEANPNAEAQN